MSLLSFNKKNKGFTLVELLVSITIMVTIMSVVLFNQNHYTSGASLKNNANDLSLALRQAQIYGISVKQLAPDDFSAAYGISFDITSAGSKSAYIFFADRGTPANKFYDDSFACPIGGSSECLSKSSLSTNNSIGQVCAILADDSPDSHSRDCTLGRVDITFKRPATEANFVFFNMSGAVVSYPNAKGARIELVTSAGADQHAVEIYTTGQISVQ